MIKKVFTFMLICSFLLILIIGCTQKKDTNKITTDLSKTNEKKNIALVMKTLTNPFFIEMEKGARQAENEFNFKLIVKTGAKETSIEQQIAIVEQLIDAKVDAIVIAPGSSTELIPVLKRAQDAKIQIVNIDNRLDPDLSKKQGLMNVPFISVDNEKASYLSAKYISDMITKPTKVAIIEGIRGVNNAEQRKNGAMRAFNGNKNITIVSKETANWNIDEGYSVSKKIFGQNPDIGAIFCANDMMALGVIQYLDDAKIKNVLLAGFDALDEAKNAINNGKMTDTIDQQAALQGYTGVKLAFDLVNGKPSTELVKLVDAKLINLKNAK